MKAPNETEGLAALGALGALGAKPGLCADCVHREILTSPRSTFLRCGLAARDPRFPRYPPLPVLVCAGYEPRTGEAE